MQNKSNFEKHWKILLSKKEISEESFLYAVKTTGIFCRPGCSSRLPKKENVEFYNSVKDATLINYSPDSINWKK